MKQKNLQCPENDETVPVAVATLNKRGYTLNCLDPYTSKLIATVKKTPGLVLEIGAAYGYFSKQVLNKTSATMLINDIEKKHLQIIERELKEEQKTRVKFLAGNLLSDEISIEDASLDYVNLCRVSHYFSGEQLRTALTKIKAMLKPGGLFCFVSETPFGGMFKEFIPLYQERKRTGVVWPAFISDVRKYMSNYADDNPETMVLMDYDTLQRELELAQFKIDEIGYISREAIFPRELRYDGRESIGAISHKL